MRSRTALVYAFPAAVVAVVWLRVEAPRIHGGRAFAVIALALLPALLPRLRQRLAALVVAAAGAAALAFDLSLRHPLGLVERAASRFGSGFLDFYEFRLPFDPRYHEQMHGVVLVAVFGFCAALALAIAARRSLAAVAVLLVGAGWPATLLSGGNELGRGAAILIAALVLLAGLTARPVFGRAVPATALIVFCALVASSSNALAKAEFLGWQHWDFYNRAVAPVDVSYVWDSSYERVRFPRTTTTVLKVNAGGASTYWRVTALNLYAGERWQEGPLPSLAHQPPDPWLPPQARHRSALVRQEVTVEALRDTRLAGGSTPVEFDAGDVPVRWAGPGLARVPRGLVRGMHYTVWSYEPQISPRELVASPPVYPASLTSAGELDVEPGIPVPSFGTPGRESRIDALFAARASARAYRPLYQQAREVTAGASSPYAATVALESWLRNRGGFRYDEAPTNTLGMPPLVGFVVQTHEGFCQHFAGAMALMLRYLGVPARVAAGFTTGSYKNGTWTVTDHNAHMWVEAWFAGYGWLPFDPTPGRGRLPAPYSSTSKEFDALAAAALLGRGLVGEDTADFHQDHSFGERGVAPALANQGGRDVPGDVAAGGGGGGGSLVKFLLAVIAAAAALVVVLKLAIRQARFLARDPRRLASACRRELADFLVDQRLAPSRSATLGELGELVASELGVDARGFVRAASAARFGPPEQAAQEAARARSELHGVERTIRRRLNAFERLRGLLSLRSLGFSG